MNRRIFWLIPFAGFTVFAGYYRHWSVRYEDFLCCRPEYVSHPDDAYAGRDGRKEAERDILQGRVAMLTYGLPVAWQPNYREILLNEHGIELRTVAGCMVSDSLLEYVAAYNEVMATHIAGTQGDGVFESAAERARLAHEQAFPAERSVADDP